MVGASQVALVVKNLPDNAGDIRETGSIPGLGRAPVEGKGYPLQYSGLENPMDCRVHELAMSWTPLNDFHFHFPLEHNGITWNILPPSRI